MNERKDERKQKSVFQSINRWLPGFSIHSDLLIRSFSAFSNASSWFSALLWSLLFLPTALATIRHLSFAFPTQQGLLGPASDGGGRR